MGHEKEPLKDLFEQVKKELDEARQDLEAARQQIRTQRLLTQKERESLTKLVSALSAKRHELMAALQEIKKDGEATETLRRSMEETANEASRTIDAIFSEFESARVGLANRREELMLASKRIQDVYRNLNSKRSQLADAATQVPPPVLLCPSCGRTMATSDHFCDRCGVRIA